MKLLLTVILTHFQLWKHSGNLNRSKLFIMIFNFMNAAQSKRDEIVRICCINRQMFSAKLSNNRIFQSYLLRNDASCFESVSLRELRYRVAPLHPEKGQIAARFKDFYMAIPQEMKKNYEEEKRKPVTVRDEEKVMMYSIGRVWVSIIYYVLLPLHFVSRGMNLVFPMVILCAVDIGNMALLQSVMTFSWMTLFVIWMSLFVVNIKFEYLTWHIAPGTSTFPVNKRMDAVKFERSLLGYYDSICVAPVREQCLKNVFGKDIAVIIMSMIEIYDDDEY